MAEPGAARKPIGGVQLTKADESGTEAPALQDRLSRLSVAVLRISASLDVNTVLNEVVESARALTGAGCGAITTMDASGQLQDFVTSGLTPDEHQRFVDLPQGLDLWAYMREIPQPLRLADLSAHLSTVGFPAIPTLARTFLGAPVRYRDVHIGNFYLADKEAGREFTREDEEVLVLFASLAAAAIANARKHGDEQQARADLEALVDTSPVGVAVFDGRTGKPKLLNREARRIVGGLCAPDRSAEQVLEVLRCRRADGRELALDEVSLVQQWTDPETVRAEEMVLSVPDGRSVTTLVNATPIRSADGEVESMVVTLQDMTPLEELERMRAEFLGMVSHELRAPLAAIKGSAATVLGSPSRLQPAETRQFFRIIDEQADQMHAMIGDLLDAAHIETGTLSVAPEPTELAGIVDEARKTFVSGGRRNPVRIDLPADLPPVLADRQRIVQVLGNLLSNAARHAPESSAIHVAAAREGVHVALSVTDEGRGIPAERLPHLFRKYARSGSEDRGRGVGMGLGLAICKGLVEAHGGRIRAESAGTGLGTRFTFTIPVVDEADTVAAAPPARTRGRPRRGGREEPLVLVVDDDPQALAYVRSILEDAGYLPVATGDPEAVPGLIETRNPDLVLLDLLLPGTDGIELLQGVPALADRPVIFISAYSRDETIARALEVGAADYLVKPFSPTELLARIGAALRRQAGGPEPYRVGDLAVDYEERRVTLAGRPVSLTATEYGLLSALSARAGRVLTYDDLLRRVWRKSGPGDARLVRAFVRNLRRKLGDDAARPAYILTVRGVGYRMPKPGDL